MEVTGLKMHSDIYSIFLSLLTTVGDDRNSSDPTPLKSFLQSQKRLTRMLQEQTYFLIVYLFETRQDIEPP